MDGAQAAAQVIVGLMHIHWWMRLVQGLALVGRAMSQGDCGLNVPEDSRPAGGWGSIFPQLVLWAEVSSTGTDRLVGRARSRH